MTEKNRRGENFHRYNQLDEEYIRLSDPAEPRNKSGVREDVRTKPRSAAGQAKPRSGEPADIPDRQNKPQSGAREDVRTKPRIAAGQVKLLSGEYTDMPSGGNKEKKKRSGSFGRFLAVYCAVFAVLIAAGLFVFNGFIAAYEKTRHEHIIGEYISGLGEADIERLAGDAPLCGFESFAGICETLHEAVSDGDFSCVKAADHSEDAPVYSVYSDGLLIGTAVLEKSGGAAFGFTSYSVSEFDFGGRISTEITAPHGADVSINGISAGTLLTCETVPYRGASVWEKGQPGLPQTDVYTAEGFVIPPRVGAYRSGEELSCRSISAAGRAEYLFDLPDAGRHDLVITAPECAEVTLGGIPLTEKEITERGIAYESYSDSGFNRAAGELPVSVRYTVTGLYTSPDVSVTVNGAAAEPRSETDSDGTVRMTFAHPDSALYLAEIHVPSAAEAYVNGVKLTHEQLVPSASVYGEISDIAEYIKDPVSESVYRIGGLYRLPEVTVHAGGEIISPERGADGSYRVENPADSALASEHSELVRDVITKYVGYTAAGYTDLGDSAFYSAMLGCTKAGSPAYKDIVSSRHSFTQNIPCKINSLTVDSYGYRVWGENCFSCSVDFTAQLRNFRDVTDTVTGLRLYFVLDGAEWKLVKLQFA